MECVDYIAGNAMNKFITHQIGIILVTVLLFLLIMSVLTLGALSESHLQHKMSANVQEGNQLLAAAEAGLRQAENQIGLGVQHDVFEIAGATVNYFVEPINQNKTEIVCEPSLQNQLTYYRIISSATINHDYTISLQSTYVKAIKPCTEKPHYVKREGRMSWVELST